jgi:hypothetical protein
LLDVARCTHRIVIENFDLETAEPFCDFFADGAEADQPDNLPVQVAMLAARVFLVPGAGARAAIDLRQ